MGKKGWKRVWKMTGTSAANAAAAAVRASVRSLFHSLSRSFPFSLFPSPALFLPVYAAKMHNITSPLPMESAAVISVLPSTRQRADCTNARVAGSLSDVRRGPFEAG